MKDLSTDRELVRELIKSKASDSLERLEHQKALITAKEQECRKLDQRIKNLYDAISEEGDKNLRAALSQKAKETRAQLDHSELALRELKSDYNRANNVVDISNLMEWIKVFRESAFDAQPVSAQAEILKNRIRRIIVRDGGVYVEIFGKNPEPLLQLLGEGPIGTKNPNMKTPLESSRSGVRSVSKLVAVAKQQANRKGLKATSS